MRHSALEQDRKNLYLTHQFVAGVLAIIALACSPDGRDATLEEQASQLLEPNQSLTLVGNADHAGIAHDWTLTINADGRARGRISGSYEAVTAYDGLSVWRVENGAGPFRVDFAEREVWLMMVWSLIERWEGITSYPIAGGEIAPHLGLSEGQLQFENRAKGRLATVNSPNAEEIVFSDQTIAGFDTIPKSIQLKNIGKIAEYRVTSARIGPALADDQFIRPARKTEGFRFLHGIGSEVAVRQASSGHMFVRPLVNGEEWGWFLFDSGAGFSGLNGELARRAGFDPVGSEMLGGIGGPGELATRFRVPKLQLGPLLVEDLTLTDVGEMRKASKVLGEPVVGVLGWEILIRAIVEVDLRDGRLFLRDPQLYRTPAEYRHPLFLHWGVPYVIGRFEGNQEGPFMFDTGAGSRGVVFTHYSADRFNLLQKHPGTEAKLMGAGGEVSVVSGSLEWFEVGGYRTSPAPASFLTSEDGEADLFTVGFLGGAVVSALRVTLDYGRGEAGFIPRVEAKE